MSTSPLLSAPLSQLPALNGERFADALAPEAAVRQVELGNGLWAIERSGGTTQLLYIHNPTDQPQSFRPAAVFGDDATPLFLSGAISTAGEEGAGLTVQLAPQGDVWLACTDPTSKETV